MRRHKAPHPIYTGIETVRGRRISGALFYVCTLIDSPEFSPFLATLTPFRIAPTLFYVCSWSVVGEK